MGKKEREKRRAIIEDSSTYITKESDIFIDASIYLLGACEQTFGIIAARDALLARFLFVFFSSFSAVVFVLFRPADVA